MIMCSLFFQFPSSLKKGDVNLSKITESPKENQAFIANTTKLKRAANTNSIKPLLKYVKPIFRLPTVFSAF